MNSAQADTYSHMTTADATIHVQQSATISATLTQANGALHAGDWGEGQQVATLQVNLQNGDVFSSPAARWTPAYPKQDPVAGCEACRNIESALGEGVLPLKLTCADANSVDGWQFVLGADVMTCTIATAQLARGVVAGNYTLSLDAALRTE
ncbi:hypothetical protein I5Q31_05580 [Serratia marcescens]|nr:hypothetical protein [Serratia marcescens]MBH2766639.1 hypothetical protein [Serratia marcescens]MBH2766699.1 hypothetical protein [Serratia marcescens]